MDMISSQNIMEKLIYDNFSLFLFKTLNTQIKLELFFSNFRSLDLYQDTEHIKNQVTSIIAFTLDVCKQ